MSEPHPTYLKLKIFFESDPLCREAVRPLSDNALMRIRFTDHEGDYRFTARGGVPLLVPGRSDAPDVTVIVPPKAIDEILAVPNPSVAAYGVRILELATQDDLDLKVRGWTDAGLFTLWRHGYFGYARMGGGEVWNFLVRRGYGSISLLYRKMVRSRPKNG